MPLAHLRLTLVALLFVGACASVSPDELASRVPPSTTVDPAPTTVEGAADADDVPTPTTVPATTTVAPAVLSGSLSGSLVIGGLTDLVVTEPDGSLVGSFPTVGALVNQPTWSRDGEALIATAIGEPVSTIAVRDGAVTIRPARRPYFFFSWSAGGEYIAALGPGPLGTSLDILGPDGVPVAEESLDTASFYLAWEPGGDDLVIHRDRTLELVRDPADLTSVEVLGEPGQSFLAPAWIPGTREILIVDDTGGGGRLVRLDVDTLVSVDLGPVDGSIGISVAPDGSRAVLAHSVGPAGGDVAVGFVQNEVTAATELVDLATGERTPISDELSIWTEWSRDGSRLALMQPAADLDGAVWTIWDGDTLTELEPFRPTVTFFRNYVFFSWQYTEAPRIWSPDSDAIVYAASDGGSDAIWVREIDGTGPVRVADGAVAFWSPG